MMKFIVNGTIGSSASALNRVEGELGQRREQKMLQLSMGVTNALVPLLSRKVAMFRNAQVNKCSLLIAFASKYYIFGMEISLTAKMIFQLIANGMNGSLAIVLQHVEMELEKITGPKNRKNSMEERNAKGMQKWQKHASLGFVQVNAAKT